MKDGCSSELSSRVAVDSRMRVLGAGCDGSVPWPSALPASGNDTLWVMMKSTPVQEAANADVLHVSEEYDLMTFRSFRECNEGWTLLEYAKKEGAHNAADRAYRHLLRDILQQRACVRRDRTGTGTLSVFGRQLRFDISKYVPLLSTKYVPWRTVLHELLWFMRGDTDVRSLQARGVRIWDGNTTRAALDARGLTHLQEHDMGAGYPFQWRRSGATYRGCDAAYEAGEGVDQLKEVLRLLREEPFSRRIFMTSWNPSQLEDMALPPCHVSCQFYVDTDGVGLSCHVYQRSCDVFLGCPFNMFSYAALTHVLAAMSGLRPRELILSLGDAHVYANHVEQVQELLSRPALAGAVLKVDPSVAGKSFEEVSVDDFEVVGYMRHPAIPAPMAV